MPLFITEGDFHGGWESPAIYKHTCQVYLPVTPPSHSEELNTWKSIYQKCDPGMCGLSEPQSLISMLRLLCFYEVIQVKVLYE